MTAEEKLEMVSEVIAFHGCCHGTCSAEHCIERRVMDVLHATEKLVWDISIAVPGRVIALAKDGTFIIDSRGCEYRLWSESWGGWTGGDFGDLRSAMLAAQDQLNRWNRSKA